MSMLRGRPGLSFLRHAQWSSTDACTNGLIDHILNDGFVAQCRREYKQQGWLHVPSFVSSDACALLRSEALKLLRDRDTSFRSFDSHTVFQEEQDASFPNSHPRNALQDSSKVIADFARLPHESPLRELYQEKVLRSFIQKVVREEDEEEKRLFLSACPYNAAFYNLYEDGDGLGWHFDRGAFGVNLVLQQPLDGGDFEYHANTRTIEDMWQFQRVSQILDGDRTGVVTVQNVAPGSLLIFSGRMSMHRVSPVRAGLPRINAIVHFETQPGQRLNAYSLKKFFGRTVDI